MTLDVGTGGGGWGRDVYGNVVPVDPDEEERKRWLRMLAAITPRTRHAPIARSAAPLSPTAPPKPFVPPEAAAFTPAADRIRWRQYVEDAPRDVIVGAAKQAEKTLSVVSQRGDGSQSGPLEEYWKLAMLLGGQHAVDERIRDVHSLWTSYMKDLIPAPLTALAVWSLVKSGYDLPTLDSMVRQAALAVRRPAKPGDPLRPLRDAALQHARLNPADPYAGLAYYLANRGVKPVPDKAPSVMTMLEDRLRGAERVFLSRRPDGSVDWSGTAKMHAEALLGAAALTGPVLMTGGAGLAAVGAAGSTAGATLTGAAAPTALQATVLGGTRAAAITLGAQQGLQGLEEWQTQNREKSLIEQAKEEAQPFAVAVTRNVLEAAQKLPEKDAQAILRDLWRRGYKVNPENGWDEDNRVALARAAQDEIYRNVDQQIAWIEAGFASRSDREAKIDGNINTPYWQAVKARALEEEQARQRFIEEHPLRGMWQANVYPFSGAGWKALITRLQANGVPQAPLSAMLQAFWSVGGAAQGAVSLLTAVAALDNDPIYQQASKALNDHVLGRTDLYSRPELMLLTTREAFRDQELQEGKLRDDPKAQELYQAVRRRRYQVALASATPSTIVLLGNLLRMDPLDVERFAKDHKDLDQALGLIRDIGLAVLTHKPMQKLLHGSPVPARVESFMGDARAQRAVREAVKYVRRNDATSAGMVEDITGSRLLAQDWTRAYRGSAARGSFWRDLADELAKPARKGDRDAVLSTLRSSHIRPELVDDTADLVIQQARKPVRPEKAPAGPYPVVAERLARTLGRAQKERGLLDLDSYALEHAARVYATGADPSFAYLRQPGLGKGGLASAAHRAWLDMINRTENPYLRRYLSLFNLPFEGAPVSEVDYVAHNTGDRVFDAAYVASGDVGFAFKMRSKWTLARSKAGFDAVAEEIERMARKTYAIANSGEEPRRIALNVNPLTGELAERQALVDTGQAAYKMRFASARHGLWAPINIVDEMPGFERALVKYVVNPSRAAIFGRSGTEGGWTVAGISRRLRTISVGWPLLMMKHTVTDTARTMVEEGARSVLAARRQAAEFERILSQASPDVANQVRATMHAQKLSEQYYNVGGGNIPYHFGEGGRGMPIYEEVKPGVFKPTRMSDGVDALRRIAIGPAFRAYAAGGTKGLFEWLRTTEGRRFLATTNNLAQTKATLEALDMPVKGRALMEQAVLDYLDYWGKNWYEPLEKTAPQIMEGLKRMALNNEPMTAANIEALVRRVNRDGLVENPYLSLPTERKSWFDRPIPGTPGGTAFFMIPNKVNRVLLFRGTFNRVYKGLVKDGMPHDNAVRVASDIAAFNTARVHFDLANALNLEAQNRWFAWFGTKHRLYNTYLLRLAVERPAIAAAVRDVTDWIEQRNAENPAKDEFSKYTIDIPLERIWPWARPGDRWQVNPATIVWAAEYPATSTFGQGVLNLGAEAVNLVAGQNVFNPSFGDYGIQTSRVDGLIKTLAAALPILDAARKGELTDEWLQEYLEPGGVAWMTETASRRIKKAIAIQQFVNKTQGRDITPAQAAVWAANSALIYQLVQLGKPIAGKFVFGAEDDMATLMEEYQRKNPEERLKMIEEKPQIGAVFGATTTNPVTKYNIEQGYAVMKKAREEQVAKLEQALDDGTIFDSNVIQAIQDDYERAIRDITDPNSEHFNKDFARELPLSGYDRPAFKDALSILYPFVDPKVVALQGHIPTQEEIHAFLHGPDGKGGVEKEFAERRSELGWDVLDDSHPAVKWLRYEIVEKPLHDFTRGVTEGEYAWETKRQEWVARRLARGSGGPMTVTKYLNEVHLVDKLKAYAAGTDPKSTDGINKSALLFAAMPSEKKAEIGWNSDTDTEYIWRMYSFFDAAQKVHMRKYHINPTSKRGKAITGALVQWAEEQARNNPEFKREWEFSHKRLDERLMELGIGTSGKPSDRGWQEFLSLVASYRNDLRRTYNPSTRKLGVSPGAQAAGPVAKYYIDRIARLADQYKDWWWEFHTVLGWTPTKFGFHWRSDDNEVNWKLWGSEPEEEYKPEWEVE